MLYTTSLVLAFAASVQESSVAPSFAPPVMIEAGGAPINAADDILYPTPVLIDVDADGEAELVVGDLRGNLFVHERVAVEGSNAIVWGERTNLKHSDGSNVQLPNW